MTTETEEQTKPLTRDDISKADRAMTDRIMHDLRDIALMHVAYDTMARASELVAFNVGDLKRGETHSINIGKGEFRFISHATYNAIQDWFLAVDTTHVEQLTGSDLPMFCTISNGARADRLSGSDVTQIIKKRFGDEYSADSLRQGASVDLHTPPTGKIMKEAT